MVHGRKAAERKRQRRRGRKGGERGRVLALSEAVEILIGGRAASFRTGAEQSELLCFCCSYAWVVRSGYGGGGGRV